ncbi:Pimeloyl-ACP methyl ester carboxylesterase [Roseovarius marisflavi]|uniref:Pimeloyl-ACP methyl ester carboxylesterase n=2 Tax=Roseovarius marisflavi TaxID=1054996 RepID=A0A1M6YD21_9RHOB|nr:Pimeloyl-ACP methyl ester carboxylesterase [Roseovarius marisflavi]
MTFIWRASSNAMPRAEKAGFDTCWTTFGQGPRAALMLHCSLAHSASWGGMARVLSGALGMVAFDAPGHGRSGAWDERGEIQDVTTRIAASFLEGPTDIIGHSFGATVALRLAVERPELVRSLILYEPVFFGVALADHPEMRGPHEAELAMYVQGMTSGDYHLAAEGFIRVWGDGRAWSDIPAEARAAMAVQMPLIEAAAPALYDDAGGMLASGALERISAPALLLEGSQSPAIIAAINEGLAARLGRVERSVVIGAGHMGPMTHPKQVSSEVLRFLAWT